MLNRFIELLEQNDKGAAMDLCRTVLDKREISIAELYEQVLAPALNRLEAAEENIEDLIWREHAMSAIVRSIIEASYPYVLRERSEKNLLLDRKVLILCPAQEEHEIGARMAADFFLIQGYDVTYIGANTPEDTVKNALARLQPDYVSISVSNQYNLFTAKRLIDGLRAFSDRSVRILVGGSAFAKPGSAEQIGADLLVQSYADIERLRREEEAGS